MSSWLGFLIVLIQEPTTRGHEAWHAAASSWSERCFAFISLKLEQKEVLPPPGREGLGILDLTWAVFRRELWVNSGELATEFTQSLSFTHTPGFLHVHIHNSIKSFALFRLEVEQLGAADRVPFCFYFGSVHRATILDFDFRVDEVWNTFLLRTLRSNHPAQPLHMTCSQRVWSDMTDILIWIWPSSSLFIRPYDTVKLKVIWRLFWPK